MNSARSRSWIRGFRRFILLLFFGGGGLWLTHSWWLPRVAELLIYSDSAPEGDYIISLAGRAGLEQASRRLQLGEAQRLLLLDDIPSRVEALGIMPRQLEQAQRQVVELQIPTEQVGIFPHRTGGLNSFIQGLDRELTQHPDRSYVLLVGEWQSRRVRWKTGRLPRSARQRVQIVAVDNPEVDPVNWWQTRRGIRTVFSSLTQLVATWVSSGGELEYKLRTPEEFRRAAVAPSSPPFSGVIRK